MAVKRSVRCERSSSEIIIETYLEVSRLSLGGWPIASTFTVSSIVYSPSINTMHPSVNKPSPGTCVSALGSQINT